MQRSIEAAVTQRRGISEVAASEPALVARESEHVDVESTRAADHRIEPADTHDNHA